MLNFFVGGSGPTPPEWTNCADRLSQCYGFGCDGRSVDVVVIVVVVVVVVDYTC